MISIKFIEKIPVTSTNAAGIMKSGIPVPKYLQNDCLFYNALSKAPNKVR